MKLDHEYMKNILSALRDNDRHFMKSEKLFDQIGGDLQNRCDERELDKFIGHIRILFDEACIDSSSTKLGFSQTASDKFIVTSCRYRLTARGYEFLDALSKQSVFDRIKDHSVSIAIEAGKQLLIEGLKKGIIG